MASRKQPSGASRPKLLHGLHVTLKGQHLDTASSTSNAPSDIYSYQPLSDARNIRLLRIRKGEGPIHVSLKEAVLDRSNYDTLSYTWGSPIEQHDNHVSSAAVHFIYCNNKRHQVTENLFHALVQFRAFGWKGPFWIDAVCIDQGNLIERNTQVLMMGDIYAKSRNVVIWLGESDSETEEAISLITKFGNAVEVPSDSSNWSKCMFNDPKFYEKTGLEPFRIAQWELIAHFLARRWFRRLWVLQEIVLGTPTNVVIGHYILEFEALQFTVGFLNMSRWDSSIASRVLYPTTKSQMREFAKFGTFVVHTALSMGACKDKGPELPANRRYLRRVHGARNPYERRYAYLWDAIEKSRGFDAQDPRDRIYAPLSLVSRFVPPKQQAQDWIIPDYSQPIPSVFTTVSVLMVKKLPTISLLSLVEDQEERLSTLPSWVPDFSCQISAQPLIFFTEYDVFKSLDYIDDRG
jgi:hypothetical protein